MTTSPVTKLYRYYDGYRGDYCAAVLDSFYVMKETPCGYWYADYPQQPKKSWRWVSKDARVRRVYQTKELAWASYRRRKEVHLSRLEHEVDMARRRWEAVRDMEYLPNDYGQIELAKHGIRVLDL